MNKKSKNIVAYCVTLLLSFALGAFMMWQFLQIKHKNEEIASLKEELSQTQTDRFRDILRFGQWKLKVEELAEKNGWQLPEMNDSLLTLSETIPFEAKISAEKAGDSLHVTSKSVKIEGGETVSEAE